MDRSRRWETHAPSNKGPRRLSALTTHEQARPRDGLQVGSHYGTELGQCSEPRTQAGWEGRHRDRFRPLPAALPPGPPDWGGPGPAEGGRPPGGPSPFRVKLRAPGRVAPALRGGTCPRCLPAGLRLISQGNAVLFLFVCCRKSRPKKKKKRYHKSDYQEITRVFNNLVFPFACLFI